MNVKTFFAMAALLALALPATAPAAEAKDPHAQHMAPAAKTAPAVHKAAGTVKAIDAANGKVTLAHGPVPALKWPAMTMGFKVADKALFEKLAVNKKIEFEFIEQDASYVVTAIK